MRRYHRFTISLCLIMLFSMACNFNLLEQLSGAPDAPTQPRPGTQTSPAQPGQGSPTLAPPSTPGIASLGPAPAADLVRQITHQDSSLIQSFEAVQEALARGGIATMDENGVYVAAYPPASPMPDTHPDILAMTLEERNHAYRMTLEDLAQGLKDLGWPYSSASTPGEQLVSFLAAWISAAHDSPSDPLSFTPLFLAEMAQQQVPPVDLSSGSADPTQVHLSMLELALFSAAFDRIMVFPQSSIPPSPKAAVLPRSSLIKMNLSQQEEDPCTKFKRFFYGPLATVILPDPLGKQLGDFGITYIFGEALNKAIEGIGMDAEAFGKAVAAVNVLGRISKLIELYSSLSVSVSVHGDNPVHKPMDGEAEKEVILDATVGVSEEDWNNYEQKYGELGMKIDRIARDCMSVLGLPTIADAGDIAKAVEGFAVEWSIVSGSPEHAYDAREDVQDQGCGYHLGRLRCSVMPVSDHSGKSSYVMDVLQNKPPETQAIHESGDLQSSSVEVCAQVDASEPPSLSTFINGAMGGLGLANSITELVSGMILKLGKPEGCTTLGVTWHVDRGFTLEGSVTRSINQSDRWATHSSLQVFSLNGQVKMDATNLAPNAGPAGLVTVSEQFDDPGYHCKSNASGPFQWQIWANFVGDTLKLKVFGLETPVLPAYCWFTNEPLTFPINMFMAEFEIPYKDGASFMEVRDDPTGVCSFENCKTTLTLDFHLYLPSENP